MILPRLVIGGVLAVAAARAAACGSSAPAAPTAREASVAVLAVTGPRSVNIGQDAQLTATAMMSDGTIQTVTASAAWASSNGSVLTVSAGGRATANSFGEVDVRATYQGVTGTFHIAVSALVGSGAPIAPAPSPIPTPPNLVPTPPPLGTFCGVERWAVKTLSDPDAPRVNLKNVTSTTIAALNALDAHCSSLPDARTFPEEFRVYEVTGVARLARAEGDRDVSIVLEHPRDATQTVVAAVIDPHCSGAAQSPFLPTLTQARSQYLALGPVVGATVRVRGVGFYDSTRGQVGRARSCIELHPVLDISK